MALDIHHRATVSRPLIPSVRTIAVLAVGFLGLTACSSHGTDADSPVGDRRSETTSPPATTTIESDANSSRHTTGAVVEPGDCSMPESTDQVLDVESAVFGSTDRVSVHFTPCTIDQPRASSIIYLLHGAGADETQWPDVDIFAAADAAVRNGSMPPTILVAPDAAAGYVCGDCAGDLFTHLIDEIEPVIERVAPVDGTRRAIGGISLGGGLALQVAGFAPDRFVAVGAHSSVSAHDEVLAAIATALLPVRFDVGDDDNLVSRSESMSSFIGAHGGVAELAIGRGGHDRDYWRSQADAYISFYATYLR